MRSGGKRTSGFFKVAVLHSGPWKKFPMSFLNQCSKLLRNYEERSLRRLEVGKYIHFLIFNLGYQKVELTKYMPAISMLFQAGLWS